MGFKETPIVMDSCFGKRTIGAEHDAILIANQEVTRRERLPSEFGNARGMLFKDLGLILWVLAVII